VRDLDRIQEVSEYRVTGPQLGTLCVLILILVSFAGLAGYQAGVMHGPVDEELLNPNTGAAAGGSAVLADMLAERKFETKPGSDEIEGVPPRMDAPGLGSSLTDPNPDLEIVEISDAPEGEQAETTSDASAEQSPETVTEEQPPEDVNPEPATAAPETTEEGTEETSTRPASQGPKGRGFTIQLAAYPSSKEADELVASLRAAGFKDAFYQVAKVNGRTWYRVRVGVYRSRPEAESAAGRLAGVSPYDPYITTHP
jgi:DedD protein